MSTKAESTESVQGTSSSRDPRLRRNEPEPEHIQEPIPVEVRKPVLVQETRLIEDRGSLLISTGHGHIPTVPGDIHFEQRTGRPPEHFTDSSHPDLEAAQTQEIRSVQHMTQVKHPENESRIQPKSHLDREVTGSPKYGDVQKPSKPKRNHRRRSSGDWPSKSPDYENSPDEPPKMQVGRGKPRRGRRRSAEKQRERGKGERGRGRVREPIKRSRDIDNEQFQNVEFQNDQRFSRRQEQRDSRHPGIIDRHVEVTPSFRDDWNSELKQRNDNFMPHDEHPGHWRRDPTEFVRGNDQSRPGMAGPERPPVRDRLAARGDDSPMHVRGEFVREGSPGMHEQRLKGIGLERERIENMERFEPQSNLRPEPEFRLREETQSQFDPREMKHPPGPFHDDPRDQLVGGEPLSKKPRPLLSDVEINELRNRKGESPMREPMDVHPHPLHADHPFPREHSFQQNFGPPAPGMRGEFRPHTPPLQPHPGEWTPGFEIPRELMLDHRNEIMIQVCKGSVDCSYNRMDISTCPLAQASVNTFGLLKMLYSRSLSCSKCTC